MKRKLGLSVATSWKQKMESSNGIINFMGIVRANVAYEFRDCGSDFHEPNGNSLEEASIQSILGFQRTTN